MKYTFDSKSLLKDGKRWFPVMGEIHFSRCPRQFWKESLMKMKAGGVDIVSTYVFWIHHEEIEGEYDWTGNRDLHAFIKAASECGVKILLRIGPWSHGEARNGGFPDWLLKKDFEVRTNDERYFDEVAKWYKAVYGEVSEFVGSTIIGVQIENEFGHCGGLYDETGEEHMKRLTKMAKDTGFVVDLYTATGWGGARTGGLLPVMGGYCDAPWDQSTEEIEPSGNYVFTKERNDHNIGSDHGFGYGITFDISKFPYLTAELGGGLQPTAHRRTVATAKDIASVSLVKLGSGCNLLGYYMYHGGTNPDGKLTTLQETKATGYPNDLPVKNYDFRAPIREFGDVSDTYRELKLLSYFVHDYGEVLCSLDAVIPDENPLSPSDTEHLRYSYRSDGNRGYLFVNNYVRHQTLSAHKGVSLSSPDKKTAIRAFDVENKDFFFVPFNMAYGKSIVKSASATPLCRLEGADGEKYVFYAREGKESEGDYFDFASGESEGKSNMLVLSRKDALNAWKISDSRLLITSSDASVFTDENGKVVIRGRTAFDDVCCSSSSVAEFFAYPAFESAPDGWSEAGVVNKNLNKNGKAFEFVRYIRKISSKTVSLSAKEIASKDEKKRYSLDFSSALALIGGETSDCFVTLDYDGNRASLYDAKAGNKLLLDHFYLGKSYPWQIGLKRFLHSDLSSLELVIEPLLKSEKIYLEERPTFEGESLAVLNAVRVQSEWSFTL